MSGFRILWDKIATEYFQIYFFLCLILVKFGQNVPEYNKGDCNHAKKYSTPVLEMRILPRLEDRGVRVGLEWDKS